MKRAHLHCEYDRGSRIEDEWKFELGWLGGHLLRQGYVWKNETDYEWSATLWLSIPWGRGHNFSTAWSHGYPDADTDWGQGDEDEA